MFLYQDLETFGNSTDKVEMCYDSNRSNQEIMSNMASYFFHIYEVHALDSNSGRCYSSAKKAPGVKLSEGQKHDVVMQFETALFNFQTRCGNTMDGRRMTLTPGVPPFYLSHTHAL